MTRRCRRCGRRRRIPDQIADRGIPTCHDCARAHQQAYRQAWDHARWSTVRADPVRWHRYLEDCRINYRLRVERNQGRQVALIPPDRYQVASKKWGVDPVPLATAVRRWMGATGESIADVACRAGVSERLITAHLNGHEREHITVDAADKLAVAIGLHLDVIYD